MSFLGILSEVTILVVYILIGYILKRTKIISDIGLEDISKIIVNLALPLLTIKAMSIGYKPEYAFNILYVILLALLFFAYSYLASGSVVKLVRADESEKKSMKFSMIFGNSGFLGYPICYALFGEVGVLYASIFVTMQIMFLWTFGVNIFRKQKGGLLESLKNVINPGNIGILIGLAMFFMGLKPPEMVQRVIDGIGNITVPLALIMTGAILYGFKFKEIIINRKIFTVAIFKVMILPIVFLALLYFLPIDQMLKSIMTIQAAAPVAASSTAFAKNYNGEPQIIAKSTFLSTLMCLVTIPLFLVLINL